MKWTLEVIVVPVSDVDRANSFYSEKVGFVIDHYIKVDETTRFVQLTPPGSDCTIVIGSGIFEMPPGSINGLQLVVNDIHAAREELIDRGVDVSEIKVMGENPEPQPDPLDNVGFYLFQ